MRRVFPGEMRITVEERLPTLRVVRRDGTVLLLDRENVVLGRLGTPGETNDPAPSADGEPAESGTSRSATLSEAMPVPLPVMANPAESLPTVTGIETREEANRVLDDPALRRGVMVLERLRGLRTEGGALGDMDLAQVVVEAGHPFMLRVRLPHGPTLVVPEDRAGPALATYIRLLTTQPALLEGSTVIDLSTLAPDGGGRVFLRPR